MTEQTPWDAIAEVRKQLDWLAKDDQLGKELPGLSTLAEALDRQLHEALIQAQVDKRNIGEAKAGLEAAKRAAAKAAAFTSIYGGGIGRATAATSSFSAAVNESSIVVDSLSAQMQEMTRRMTEAQMAEREKQARARIRRSGA